MEFSLTLLSHHRLFGSRSPANAYTPLRAFCSSNRNGYAVQNMSEKKLTCVTIVIPNPLTNHRHFLNSTAILFIFSVIYHNAVTAGRRHAHHHPYHFPPLAHTGPRSFERVSIKQLLRAEQQVRGRSIAVAAGRLGKLCWCACRLAPAGLDNDVGQ